jgi:hypothetical protein
MNLSLIQNMAWLGSAALAGCLGYYLYDFKQHQAERLAVQSQDVYNEVLNNVEYPDVIDTADFDFDVIKTLYQEMNWTGKPPPVVVEVDVVEGPAKEQVKVSVASLLDVVFINAALFDATVSMAYVSYTDTVLRRKVTDGMALLRVGDHLPDPHQAVFVKKILSKGVLFGFDKAEGEDQREPELLMTPVMESGVSIVDVGDGEAKKPGDSTQIAESDQAPAYNPAETYLVSPGHYKVGTNDAAAIADSYASIIANTKHRQHRDPNTRQPDGIQVTDVPAGSFAAKHGVKEGDVIKSINGHPVTTAQEAIQFAQNNSEKYTSWEILIENQGVERTVVYEVPQD